MRKCCRVLELGAGISFEKWGEDSTKNSLSLAQLFLEKGAVLVSTDIRVERLENLEKVFMQTENDFNKVKENKFIGPKHATFNQNIMANNRYDLNNIV